MSKGLERALITLVTMATTILGQYAIATAPQMETRKANRDGLFECLDRWTEHMEEHH